MLDVISHAWRRDGASVLLMWLGGLAASGIVCLGECDLRLAHPALLLAACLGLMWPARRTSIQQVQVVVFLYLMWMLAAACFDLFWKLPGPAGSSIHVSATLPIAVLVVAGAALRRASPAGEGACSPLSNRPVLAALALLGLHMLFLMALLRPMYGFGWEQDGAVLGRVGLCAIVLCCLGPPARSFGFRASLSLIVALVLWTRRLP